MTTTINGHVVTRWSETAYEVGSWGRKTVDFQVQFEDEHGKWIYLSGKFSTLDEAKRWFYELMAKGMLRVNPDGSVIKYRIVRHMAIEMVEVDLVK
jgi:hypothetical protein